MITIQITNVSEIVEKQRGWFVANVVGAVVDMEPKVEDVIVEKLKLALSEQGIHAAIERVVAVPAAAPTFVVAAAPTGSPPPTRA
jgi:hypothetical protein